VVWTSRQIRIDLASMTAKVFEKGRGRQDRCSKTGKQPSSIIRRPDDKEEGISILQSVAKSGTLELGAPRNPLDMWRLRAKAQGAENAIHLSRGNYGRDVHGAEYSLGVVLRSARRDGFRRKRLECMSFLAGPNTLAGRAGDYLRIRKDMQMISLSICRRIDS
jgi:hypothetical protein